MFTRKKIEIQINYLHSGIIVRKIIKIKTLEMLKPKLIKKILKFRSKIL